MTERAAAALDQLRSALLRLTLGAGLLRRLFVHRASRLPVLFALSSATSFGLSLALAPWVLGFGPVIYGVPHLFSSLRYFHYTLREPQSAPRRDSARIRSFLLVAALMALIP